MKVTLQGQRSKRAWFVSHWHDSCCDSYLIWAFFLSLKCENRLEYLFVELEPEQPAKSLAGNSTKAVKSALEIYTFHLLVTPYSINSLDVNWLGQILWKSRESSSEPLAGCLSFMLFATLQYLWHARKALKSKSLTIFLCFVMGASINTEILLYDVNGVMKDIIGLQSLQHNNVLADGSAYSAIKVPLWLSFTLGYNSLPI